MGRDSGHGPVRVGLTLAAVYLGWLLVGRPGSVAWPWLDELFWMAMTAATALGCWQVLRYPGLPAGIIRPWYFGVAAMVVLGGSLLLDAALRAMGAVMAADVAGLLGLLHLPLVAAALLLTPTAATRRTKPVASALDLLILAVAGALLLWLVVMRGVVPPLSSGLLVQIAAYGFPVAQLAALGCVAAVWLRRPAAIIVWPLACITVALGATLAGDLVLPSRLEAISLATPLAAELAWLLGAVAGLLAPVAQLRALQAAPVDRAAVLDGVPSLAPYVLATFVVAGLVTTEAHWHNRSELLAQFGTVSVLGLVVLRQWIAHRAHMAALESQARMDARYTALVEGSSDIVVIADAAGALCFVSPSVEHVLGYAPDQVLGASMRAFLHPDEQSAFDEIFTGLIARGETETTVPSTWRVRTHDGRWLHLHSTAANRTDDPAVRGVVLHGRDVSTQLDLEERLRQARQMEAIGRFASVIAHDFNHVLSAIKLNVQLQQDAPEDGAAAEEILTAVELGAALTRQLMAVSQHRSAAPVVLDVVAVIRGLERSVRLLVGPTSTLHIALPGAPVHVRADAAQLRQVLMNLLINARDAAPGGQIHLRVETRLLTMDDARRLVGLKPGPHMVLAVEDDGTGMPAQVLQHLFEPFFTTKSGGRGTGLGLTIVYGIVTSFGGVIRASSTEGAGSRFEILLPRIDDPGAEVTTGRPVVTSGRSRVLIVDDDPAIRFALQRAFTLRGYTVLVAADGLDAMEHLREHGTAIHLVLTDMRMPRLDGPGLVEAMAGEWPTIPVLGMSGFLHADDHARLAPRMHTIIEKPFTFDEVLRAVDAALG